MRFISDNRMARKASVLGALALLGCTNATPQGATATLNPVEITEWQVPWEHTRPRDPYVDQQHRVWFVGQRGDYLAVLDPKTGQFKRYALDPGTGPHNVIVDEQGTVWYAGNRAAHIGQLDPDTGRIQKHMMPDLEVTDPHTLVFGNAGDMWFTVQQGNRIGHLAMDTGQIHLIPVPTPHARPYGIDVTSDGTPWFTEFGVNKLGSIHPATKSVQEFPIARSEARPRRLTITSDGAIWYVDYAEGYLGRLIPKTRKIREWPVPGGAGAYPYGMTSDDQDRVWFVETGSQPNRLVGFDTQTLMVISVTPIQSGGGTVRHMVYHQSTQTIWFGTDANTLGRARLP